MIWPKDRQAEMYRRHARKAYKQAIRWMKDHEEQILAEGERRLLGPGFDEHGDASFRMSYAQMEESKLAKASDLVVHGVTQISNGWR